jgi:SAM-dependent methyltransferase
VLDVGCGTGRLLRAARPCFPAAELVGVDPAGQMVATAIAVTPSRLGIRYVQARAERLPFPDASFDLVFATMSLRHWADPRVGMAEVAGVLRPTGMLVLADIFSDTPHRNPWVRVVRRRRRSPAPAELKALRTRQRLEVAGLERVRWFGLPDVQVLGLHQSISERRPSAERPAAFARRRHSNHDRDTAARMRMTAAVPIFDATGAVPT